MPLQVKSPIHSRAQTFIEKKISCVWLKNQYKKLFGINIEYLIPRKCTEIIRYKCSASGYRFYKPACIIGDSLFYEKLQEKEWYYMADKWEFHEALNQISQISKSKILEIGSGKGHFLNLLRTQAPLAGVTGLELNKKAANEARKKGLKVLVKTTKQHSRHNKNTYDFIVSFQLLEHIPNPLDMLSDSVAMLKTGGKLIVCVPNNSKQSYKSIFVDEDNILNMPPHHQGLWDIPSLSYLTKILPLRLDLVVTEPATHAYRMNSYRGLLKSALLEKFGLIIGLLFYTIARPFYNHALSHLKKFLPAHSVFVVFTKQ